MSPKSEISVLYVSRNITVLEFGKRRNGALSFSSKWKTQVGVRLSLAVRKLQVCEAHGIVRSYVEYLLIALIDDRNDKS